MGRETGTSECEFLLSVKEAECTWQSGCTHESSPTPSQASLQAGDVLGSFEEKTSNSPNTLEIVCRKETRLVGTSSSLR